MAVAGRAVQESHQHRSAGQLGEGADPWQEPDPAPEEGNLLAAIPAAGRRQNRVPINDLSKYQ
jgi:hypothetical protein